MNAWEEVQRRLRNRRDRLETPSPAHDYLIVPSGDWLDWYSDVSNRGPLGQAIINAIELCEDLEEYAAEDGSLWARQQADEALSFALRLAARLCERKGVTP
jgi:hypothetical protein